MEAKVKATGEIGIVANIDLLFGNKGYRYQSDEVEIIDSHAEVDTGNDTEIDYWTRLEHTYAGMAMQGMLSGWWTENIAKITYNDVEHFNLLTHKAKELAHALVEKMKEVK